MSHLKRSKNKKKLLTLTELKKKLEELKHKFHHGIKPTKVFRDKTKYRRNKKHKNKDKETS